MEMWLVVTRTRNCLWTAQGKYDIIIIIIIIIITAIGFSLGGSSPYSSTDKSNKNKYTQTKQHKSE